MATEQDKYVRMSKAATHLQALSPYKGWGSLGIFKTQSGCEFFGTKTIHPNIIDVTWLPSVEDLTGLIPGGNSGLVELLVLFARDMWIGREYAFQFISLRQFLMAAVMWKVHARVWADAEGKWFQIGIDDKGGMGDV